MALQAFLLGVSLRTVYRSLSVLETLDFMPGMTDGSYWHAMMVYFSCERSIDSAKHYPGTKALHLLSIIFTRITLCM